MTVRLDIVEKVKNFHWRPTRRDGVFLLLDEIPRETKTPAGVIILAPTLRDTDSRQATVVGVGFDVNSVRVDDRVLIGKYYGTEIPYDDSNVCRLVMVSEDQVLAVIEND